MKAKYPKRAVRRRHNRRRQDVGLVLANLKRAAENVLNQPGSVYKKTELEALITEIDRFVAATGLTPPPLPELDLEFDLFKILDQRTDEPNNKKT
jgi:hypothetical protein